MGKTRCNKRINGNFAKFKKVRVKFSFFFLALEKKIFENEVGKKCDRLKSICLHMGKDTTSENTRISRKPIKLQIQQENNWRRIRNKGEGNTRKKGNLKVIGEETGKSVKRNFFTPHQTHSILTKHSTRS